MQNKDQPDESKELLPCPFCGSPIKFAETTEAFQHAGSTHWRTTIKPNCKCFSEPWQCSNYGTKDSVFSEAKLMWNTRPTHPAPQPTADGQLVEITADKWNNLVGHRDHLHAQLRKIERLWGTDSEACADNGNLAFQMAQVARAALTTATPAPAAVPAAPQDATEPATDAKAEDIAVRLELVRLDPEQPEKKRDADEEVISLALAFIRARSARPPAAPDTTLRVLAEAVAESGQIALGSCQEMCTLTSGQFMRYDRESVFNALSHIKALAAHLAAHATDATKAKGEELAALREVRAATLAYLKITDTHYALDEWPDAGYTPEFARLLRALHTTMEPAPAKERA